MQASGAHPTGAGLGEQGGSGWKYSSVSKPKRLRGLARGLSVACLCLNLCLRSCICEEGGPGGEGKRTERRPAADTRYIRHIHSPWQPSVAGSMQELFMVAAISDVAPLVSPDAVLSVAMACVRIHSSAACIMYRRT